MLLLLTAIPAFSQSTLPDTEIRISALFSRLAARENEDLRQIADSIVLELKNALKLPGSFEYPFATVKMGKVSSSDKRVRFYTWNIPYTDGHSDYFGIIQYKPDSKSINLIELHDKSQEISAPEGLTLPADQWYGTLIYDIVVKKSGNQTLYTLLGFANEDLFLSRKTIDILTFDQNGQAWFGKPVFRMRGKVQSRLLFWYSSKVQMSLKWNERQNMIVFDHLSPSKPIYEGNFRYYGPDLSFDALRFENGFWELTEDVDARNADPGS